MGCGFEYKEDSMSYPVTSEIFEPLRAEDFSNSLMAARQGSADAFSQLTEPYRAELRAHCYRITGSLEDAEDLVQETFLRAWRRLETYEGRASFRAWLYKIATNACLDALKRLPRRTLSIDADEDRSLALSDQSASSEPAWLEPFPDFWHAPVIHNPEARYDAYESISLAFLVALQILPPRQRIVLIFADVLDWSMTDIAEALAISLSAATSLLRRARVTMKQRNESGKLDRSRLSLPNDLTRQLLDRYAHAWESADLEIIISLLADNAIFPMPPMPFTIYGKQAMAVFYAANLFNGDVSGRWKLLPIQANGQPGFAFYRLDESTRKYHAYVLQVLTVEQGLVVNATTFGFPALFHYFNLPETL
jgi:RNA polymerase sigma-70 factor (ECF subfamily)